MATTYHVDIDHAEAAWGRVAEGARELGDILAAELARGAECIEVTIGEPRRGDWMVRLWSEVRPEHQSHDPLLGVRHADGSGSARTWSEIGPWARCSRSPSR